MSRGLRRTVRWVVRTSRGALVHAGHVATVREAFDRWLGTGRPAFVPRQGLPPKRVIDVVAQAGGVASLAHPGLSKHEHLVPDLAASGLEALEVYHSQHDPSTEQRLLRLARQVGLAVSGGSDYHGDPDDRGAILGQVGLPAEEFRGLRERITRIHRAVHGEAG